MNSTGSSVIPTTDEISTPLTDETWFKIVKYLLFGPAFLISVAGNSLVAYIILTRIRMKTVTNLFILNLAIGDLIYTFATPFDIIVQENGEKWVYSIFFCKILSPLQTLSMSSSLLTLMMVSLTRYWAIIHPLKRQMEENYTKISIIVIWIVSLLTVLPQVIHQKVTDNKCSEIWEEKQGRKAYTALLFAVQYVLPLAVMAVAYSRIAVELHQQSAADNSVTQGERDREARKVISMLVTVTSTFAICTLPTSIMWLWLDFGDAEKSYSHFWDVLNILYIFDFINLAAHPIIYVYFSNNFKTEVKETFKMKNNSRFRRNSASLMLTRV